MKFYEVKFQRRRKTYTTWEYNDCTNSYDRNDWNMKYFLTRDVYIWGALVSSTTLISENVPEYAQCAWAAIGYTDWLDKHSRVERRANELELRRKDAD